MERREKFVKKKKKSSILELQYSIIEKSLTRPRLWPVRARLPSRQHLTVYSIRYPGTECGNSYF